MPTGSTNFPGGLDAFPTIRADIDLIGPDAVNHAAALNALEAELGINPSGTVATVGARLDATEVRVVAPGNLGTAYTLNMASGDNVWLDGTLNANVAITLSGVTTGAAALLRLTQDTPGNRTVAITDGVTPVDVPVDTGAGAITLVRVYSRNGTDWDVEVAGGWSEVSLADWEALDARLDSEESVHVVGPEASGVAATDFAALQAAITAAAGGVFRARPVDYLVNDVLLIPSDTTLDLRGASIERTGSTVGQVLKNANFTTGNSNITIIGGTLDRTDGADALSVDDCCFWGRYITNLNMRDVRVRGAMKGVRVEGCTGLIVDNSFDSFRDNGIAVADPAGVGEASITNPGITVSRNTFNQTSATKAAAGSSPIVATESNAKFLDNTIISTVALNGFGVELGKTSAGATGIEVRGNTLIGCGILVGNGDKLTVADNHLFEGALAGSARIAIAPTGAGTPAIARASVDNNDLHNESQTLVGQVDGIKVQNSANVTLATVTNNKLFGCRIDAAGVDTTVEGNVVEGTYETGYNFALGTRPVARGNVARDCGRRTSGGADTTKVGFTYDTLTNPVIENNVAVSSKSANEDMRCGHYVNACTGITWRDNRSRGHTTAVVTTTNSQTWNTGLAVPSVVAAATIELPMFCDVVTVTGNTNITSVTATGHAGRRVTLVFTGTPTFTDGSNLKLSANLVATADDAITLACDGTNWYETGRSVN